MTKFLGSFLIILIESHYELGHSLCFHINVSKFAQQN